MSQQSLASKTITKRNVAQSSVIFSVVVAVITLGVIAGVAYVDITENNDSIAQEKSIPELIAEQKVRLKENHRQVELLSQAEDLVATMDKRVEDLKQLDEKVKSVSEQLNYVASNVQTDVTSAIETVENKKPITIKAVQQVPEQSSHNNRSGAIKNSGNNRQFINSIFEQNQAANIGSSQHMTASGEGYIEFSWLFKARGSMTMQQYVNYQNYLKSQSQSNWNAKSF